MDWKEVGKGLGAFLLLAVFIFAALVAAGGYV
jgi:hypothetical protein